jgi:hypothetical protein
MRSRKKAIASEKDLFVENSAFPDDLIIRKKKHFNFDETKNYDIL